MNREHRDDTGLRGAHGVLAMVGELHKIGYQRIRIVPGMAPSGLHWRCAITPSSNLVGAHGFDEKDSERLVARYTTGQENRYFDWPDASTYKASELAVLFVERFPEIARAGAGEDRAYAGWFAQMLALAERGFLPLAYSDWGSDITEFLPVISLRAASEVPKLRVPPAPQRLGRSSVIEFDASGTQKRIGMLRRYVTQSLLGQDEFLCPAYAACSSSVKPGDAFREGTMSHVGRRYDLRLDGKPLRIVVVGQESGWPKDPQMQHLARRVTLEDRYRQVHDRSGQERRYYAEPGYPGRNPHMRGTTSALRVLFGKRLGDDYDGEFVQPAQGKPFHLFDGFALVNRLLCSAGPPQSSQGRPTREMFGNCGAHFAETLSILEPTLVIVQGRAVARGVAPHLRADLIHSEYLYESHINQDRVLVCSFSHPSAHGSQRWGDRLHAPYLTDVVVPTLHEALSHL